MTPHKFYNVTGEGAGGGQIPNCLSHLKTDKRGYPIPFFVPIIDGIPNFKMADAKKWHYATEQNLCWICGKKLPKAHFFFIGGQWVCKTE